MKTLQAGQSFFSQRNSRAKRIFEAAVWVIGIALLWQFSIAPAWQVWQDSRVKLTQIGQLKMQMLSMQKQAIHLQNQPHLSTEQSAQTLRNLCAALGDTTKTNRQSNRFTVNVTGIAPNVLAEVWMQARSQAQAVLIESKLQRQGDLWQGQWTWSLPDGAP